GQRGVQAVRRGGEINAPVPDGGRGTAFTGQGRLPKDLVELCRVVSALDAAVVARPTPTRPIGLLVRQVEMDRGKEGSSVCESVLEKWFSGSTGDSPDGTGGTVRANRRGLFATLLAAVPVGGSPTGSRGSPAPPIFK